MYGADHAVFRRCTLFRTARFFVGVQVFGQLEKGISGLAPSHYLDMK